MSVASPAHTDHTGLVVPLSVLERLPLRHPEQCSRYIPLRGSLDGGFGETHLVFTNHQRLWAVSRSSAVERFEAIALDGTILPTLRGAAWDQRLVVTDLEGGQHPILVDSLGRAETLNALKELYRDSHAWSLLAVILTAQAADEYSPTRRVSLQLELGELQLRQLGAPQAASATFRQVLLHDEEEPTALAGLLEVFRNGLTTLELGEFLVARLEAADRWQGALDVKEVLLEQHGGDRKALADAWLHRTADRERALAVLGVGLCQVSPPDPTRPAELPMLDAAGQSHISPTQASYWALFQRMLGPQPLRDDVAAMARDVLAAATDTTQQGAEEPLSQVGAEMTSMLAGLLADDAPAQAESLWQRILDRPPPRSEGLTQAVTSTLLGFYRKRGKVAEELACLTTLLAENPRGREAAERWTRIGRIHAGRGEQRAAQDAFMEALQAFADHLPALDALVALLADTEQWQQLCSITERRACLELDVSARAALLARAARLAATRLDQPDEAIRLWLQVRAVTPQDMGAVTELAPLLREQRRWEELAAVFMDFLTHGGRAPQERDQVRRWLARLYTDDMDATEQAEAAWLKVLEAHRDLTGNDDVEALDALWQGALRRGDWEQRCALSVRLVEATDGDRRFDALMALATAKARLSDVEASMSALRDATASAPSRKRQAEALEALAELSAASRNHETEIEARRALLEVTPATSPHHETRTLALVERLLKRAGEEDDEDEDEALRAEAATVLRSARHHHPESLPLARAWLAVLDGMGQEHDALVHLEQTILPMTGEAQDVAQVLQRALRRLEGFTETAPNDIARTPSGAVLMRTLDRHAAVVVSDPTLRRAIVEHYLSRVPGHITRRFLDAADACGPEHGDRAAQAVERAIPGTVNPSGRWHLLAGWRLSRSQPLLASEALYKAIEAGDRRAETLGAAVNAAVSATAVTGDEGELQRWTTRLTHLLDGSGGRRWKRHIQLALADLAGESGDEEARARWLARASFRATLAAWIAIVAVVATLMALILL